MTTNTPEPKEVFVDYEVYQEDELVASSNSLAHAEHYAEQYGQDGPVELRTSISIPGFHTVESAVLSKLRARKPDLKAARIAEQHIYRIRELEAEVGKLRAPVASAEVMDALNWVDDFIARCNRDDRGSCESVNVLRRALASAPVADERELPPMPKPAILWHSDFTNQTYYGYTETHMRDYGRAALASAPVAGEAQPPVLPGDALDALRNFKLSVIRDGYHKVRKQMIRQLAEAGALESLGFGKHRVTQYGEWLLSGAYAAPQASEAVRNAGIAASDDVALPPLPEALALQPGQHGHTDQTLDCFARAAVLADRQTRAALSAQPGAQKGNGDA